jgi:hypothetical protein
MMTTMMTTMMMTMMMTIVVMCKFHLELPHRKRTGCLSQRFMPSGAAAPHDVFGIKPHIPHFIWENAGGKPIRIVKYPLSSTLAMRLASCFGC